MKIVAKIFGYLQKCMHLCPVNISLIKTLQPAKQVKNRDIMKNQIIILHVLIYSMCAITLLLGVINVMYVHEKEKKAAKKANSIKK